MSKRLADREVDVRYTRYRHSEGRVNFGQEMGKQHVTVEIEGVDDLDAEEIGEIEERLANA